MRLHRNLVFSVIDGLNLIFNEGEYADKVVQKLLKRDARWGSRDRKFVAETTYDIVRWKRLYAEIADINENYSRENLWRIFAVWATLRGIELPDWSQLEGTPTRRIKGRFDEFSKIRKIKESIPDWLDELCVAELGEKVWSKEINALNKQAEVILRTNTLRTTKEKLQALLATFDNETEFVKGHPVALRLKERANIFRNDAFKNGLFEVQDANSQLVSEFLDVKPGMKVVDACAGAGGKSLHLAALMENKGNLISLDIYEAKLRELKRRARRNGAHNIETRVIDSTKVIKKLYDMADRVLIDAPCSGLGVLRRNPDAKWKIQPGFLDKVRKTQQDILQRYSKMVKPGGKLVYATCSILPSENQEQVKKFLETNEDFTFVEDKKLLASTSGFDGFYMALLERK
ncbi:Ribosomal RNA small subunit methyltransferase B [Kordia antarctica]|uniref:Ribosomal RNA small subunit methyltransferase B n=1 Tax=Kordia antarctica TaxID=1218801 RepID=A0A7L4ZQJ8_9FLAO|nr:methyltransferase domain-containing protein [Kordia antarctica]QHI38872.1 Ribosomal RNA small subunit methyltransferase B [Kordia antarctica]